MRAAALIIILLASSTFVQAQAAGTQMPDPKQMSGVPLPSGDLAVGTITVRVIRGSLSNPIADQRVDLSGDVTRDGTTNESGRAEFTGLTPGARVTAVTVVNGERLESQALVVPSSGGLRVMLVATDPEAAKRAAEDARLAQGPAQRGLVVLGDQSRFVFELGDHALNIFNILQFVNTARVPIEPAAPVVFTLPDGAKQATVLEGSSSLAVAASGRIQVNGPFPPGVTLVQFAYTWPYAGSTTTVRQVLPTQLAQVTVVAQKTGDLRVTSSQLAQQREMRAEGQMYILGQGPAVPAGGTVEFNFSGLPHAATWPRNTALALALMILGGGAVISVRGKGAAGSGHDRQQLSTTRDRLFDELTALEADHRNGRVAEATYATRRRQLLESLERVYAALNEPENAPVSGL